jgi:hypothetical protein
MADNESSAVLYLETVCPGPEDGSIESPLPEALDVSFHQKMM